MAKHVWRFDPEDLPPVYERAEKIKSGGNTEAFLDDVSSSPLGMAERFVTRRSRSGAEPLIYAMNEQVVDVLTLRSTDLLRRVGYLPKAGKIVKGLERFAGINAYFNNYMVVRAGPKLLVSIDIDHPALAEPELRVHLAKNWDIIGSAFPAFAACLLNSHASARHRDLPRAVRASSHGTGEKSWHLVLAVDLETRFSSVAATDWIRDKSAIKSTLESRAFSDAITKLDGIGWSHAAEIRRYFKLGGWAGVAVSAGFKRDWNRLKSRPDLIPKMVARRMILSEIFEFLGDDGLLDDAVEAADLGAASPVDGIELLESAEVGDSTGHADALDVANALEGVDSTSEVQFSGGGCPYGPSCLPHNCGAGGFCSFQWY